MPQVFNKLSRKVSKTVTYDRNTNRLVIYHPYDPSYIEFVKSIKGRWYEPIPKLWTLPNQRDILNKLAELISRFELDIDQSLKYSVFCDFVIEESKLNISPIEVEDQVRRQYLLTELQTLGCQRIPREYQLAGVDFMLQNERVVNGDDMGIGKTGQAILTVELQSLFPCLIICPASVKFNWKKEWMKWFPSRGVTVIDEYTSDSLLTDVLTINYDRLDKNKDWLKKIGWKSIVCDESHYLKNNKSLRSKAARSILRKTKNRYFLTGTAILNQPSELINQLSILGEFDNLFGNWKQYVIRYCNAKETRYGWDIGGASNTVELNMILRRSVYIRREKREVLHELPEIQHSVVDAEITNRKDYRRAEQDLIGYIGDNVSKVASQKAANAESLVLMNTLRTLAGRGKINSIKEFVQDFIEGCDRKLLIFAIHREVVDSIVDLFKCPKVDGSTSSQKRIEIVNAFASNNERVLVGNIQSLGVGVDGLQESCSDLLFVELPDRPADIDQAIGRLERMGAKNAINIYYLLAEKTIDIDLWESLQNKKKVVDGVLRGIDVESSSSVMGDVMRSYLKSI